MLINPKINKYKIFEKEKIRFEKWGEIFKLGNSYSNSYSFRNSCLFYIIFNGITFLITTVIASHQAALNFSGFLYTLPVSVANTATIIIAFHVGAKDYKNGN